MKLPQFGVTSGTKVVPCSKIQLVKKNVLKLVVYDLTENGDFVQTLCKT